jgi:hypothetical protein
MYNFSITGNRMCDSGGMGPTPFGARNRTQHATENPTFPWCGARANHHARCRVVAGAGACRLRRGRRGFLSSSHARAVGGGRRPVFRHEHVPVALADRLGCLRAVIFVAQM